MVIMPDRVASNRTRTLQGHKPPKRRKPTVRQQRFLQELKNAPTPTEAARRAGYSPARAKITASELMANEALSQRIQELAKVGLDTLYDVAVNGKVEVARVNAAKVLIETALGRPKSNDERGNTFGDITINVSKISDTPTPVLSVGASVPIDVT